MEALNLKLWSESESFASSSVRSLARYVPKIVMPHHVLAASLSSLYSHCQCLQRKKKKRKQKLNLANVLLSKCYDGPSHRSGGYLPLLCFALLCFACAKVHDMALAGASEDVKAIKGVASLDPNRQGDRTIHINQGKDTIGAWRESSDADMKGYKYGSKI